MAVSKEHAKPGWPFYLLWIVLTLLSLPAAFFIDLVILRLTILIAGEYITVGGVRHITEDFLGGLVLVPVAGLLTGLLQYALLRRILPRMGGWVAATLAGWLLGLLVLAAANWLHWTAAFSSLDTALVVMGWSIGIVQWLLLRRRLPRAGWWVAANAAGWMLLTVFTAGNSIGVWGLWTLSALPACATAAMLALLMNQQGAGAAPASAPQKPG
jgi:hypothetical protein